MIENLSYINTVYLDQIINHKKQYIPFSLDPYGFYSPLIAVCLKRIRKNYVFFLNQKYQIVKSSQLVSSPSIQFRMGTV